MLSGTRTNWNRRDGSTRTLSPTDVKVWSRAGAQDVDPGSELVPAGHDVQVTA
jgi:hypothetical protein